MKITRELVPYTDLEILIVKTTELEGFEVRLKDGGYVPLARISRHDIKNRSIRLHHNGEHFIVTHRTEYNMSPDAPLVFKVSYKDPNVKYTENQYVR